MAVTDQTVSRRARVIAATEPFRLFWGFLQVIEYDRRREEPGAMDFTFGDPREMPPPVNVSTLGDALTPRNEGWFAYKGYEPEAPQAAASSLATLTGLPFEPENMLLTTGGFAALSVGASLSARTSPTTASSSVASTSTLRLSSIPTP